MSEQPSEPTQTPKQVNTGGGAAINGDVDTGGGDFIGRDKITITEETAYNVEGLANPYLGLRPFSYEDRAIYAGREQLAQETVERLTQPGQQPPLLFITGASGSGKSSFAQAALIPRLEAHYTQYQKTVRFAIFRPSSQPLALLADALQKLDPHLTPETLASHTPSQHINLLLIDQFEELFTQSDPAQRTPFCDFLTHLPSFAKSRTHILITVRSDYLDELFAIQALWAIAKEGVELRTMSADELRDAIQKPVQVKHPTRRLAPDLLKRLVADAHADAALLPLLQVTLAELWKTGKLIAANYHGLTHAIRQRANKLYDFSDHDKVDPKTPRPAQDQQEIVSILLDLIAVTADGDGRGDVRQRRQRRELEQGSLQRPRLIEELINVRLLSTASETHQGESIELIDIIHESLIDNWDRLKQAVDAHRQQLQRRSRFKLWLVEWLRNERNDGYLLLTEIQLTEARVLNEQNDIELLNTNAREFYMRSLDWHEAKQQKELQRVQELVEAKEREAVAQQQKAAAESRRADAERQESEAQRRRAQTFRWATAISLLLTLLALAAAMVAVNQRQIARAGALGAYAEAIVDTDPELSAMLALRSLEIEYSPASETSLRQALRQLRIEATIPFSAAEITQIAFQPDRQAFVISDKQGILQHRNSTTGDLLHSYQTKLGFITTLAFAPQTHALLAVGNLSGTVSLLDLDSGEIDQLTSAADPQITSLAFTPDETGVIFGHGKYIKYWDRNTNQLRQQVEPDVFAISFSPDQKYVVFGKWWGGISVWDARLQQNLVAWRGHEEAIAAIAFSPNGQTFATAAKEIRIWDWSDLSSGPNPPPLLNELSDHASTINSLVFSSDGACLASASNDQKAFLWDALYGTVRSSLHHQAPVYAVQFDENKQMPSELAPQPCGNRLTTIDKKGAIHHWNIGPTYEYGILPLSDQPLFSLAVSPDHKFIAAAGVEGSIYLLDPFAGNHVVRQKLADTPMIVDLAFHPDGKWLATASQEGGAKIWRLTEARPVAFALTELTDVPVIDIAFRPSDGRHIATLSSDRRLHLWETESKKMTKTLLLPDNPNAMDFSPDGDRIAIGDENRVATVIEIETGGIITSFLHQNNVSFVTFSSNGRLLVTGDRGGDVTFRSMIASSSIQPQRFSAHNGPLYEADFSPDGRLLVTVAGDGKIIIWDVAAARPQSTIQEKPGSIYDVKFLKTPDGLGTVVADSEGTVRFYLVNIEDLVVYAQTRITRTFTPEECILYLNQSRCTR